MNLPEEVRKSLAGLQQRLPDEGVRKVELDNIHVTLFFLGELKEPQVSRVVSALESLSSPSFEMSVRGAGVFPHPGYVRVAWAGVESTGLRSLYDELKPKLEGAGLSFDPRFSPHVTVARVRSPTAKERVLEAVDEFKEKEFGSFTVNEVILFKSTLTPNGPVYSRLHTKQLG